MAELDWIMVIVFRVSSWALEKSDMLWVATAGQTPPQLPEPNGPQMEEVASVPPRLDSQGACTVRTKDCPSKPALIRVRFR